MNVPQPVLAAMRQTNELFNAEVVGKRNFALLDQVYTVSARILPPGAAASRRTAERAASPLAPLGGRAGATAAARGIGVQREDQLRVPGTPSPSTSPACRRAPSRAAPPPAAATPVPRRAERVSGSSRAKTYGSVLHVTFQLLAERFFTNGAGFLQ